MFSKDFFKSKTFIILTACAVFIFAWFLNPTAACNAPGLNGFFECIIGQGLRFLMMYCAILIGVLFLNIQHFTIKEQSQFSSSLMICINTTVFTFGVLFSLLYFSYFKMRGFNAISLFWCASIVVLPLIGVSLFGLIKLWKMLQSKILACFMVFLGMGIGWIVSLYIKAFLSMLIFK